MAVIAKTYPMFADSLAQKLVDLDSDTLKVMLLDDYTYNAAHQFLSDVKAAGTESSGGDYAAGGAALTGVSWTRSGDVWKLDANDVGWPTPPNAAFAVVYDATPSTDATRPVIGYYNLGGTLPVPGIAWASAGILTATAA